MVLRANDQYSKDRKRHFEFLHGDFDKVHRCSILAAQSRTGQSEDADVENADGRSPCCNRQTSTKLKVGNSTRLSVLTMSYAFQGVQDQEAHRLTYINATSA